MNDVERKLKQLGEVAGRELPAEVRPRETSLRRIRLRRRLAAGTAVLCTAVVAAGGVVVAADAPERRGLPPAEERREDPPGRVGEEASCGIPFEPSYLPDGFGVPLREGPGAGTSHLSHAPVLGHYSGSTGRFIDVLVASGGDFAETRTEPVEVLGARGTIGDIHEGYSVSFRVGRCRYELRAYGVTKAELRDFAQGLVATEARARSFFAAVWPEDTVGEARRGCRERRRGHPVLVARDFAEELRWDEPGIVVEKQSRLEWTLTMTPGAGDVDDPTVQPGIRMWLQKVMPMCWSVTSMSPLEERRLDALSVGVRGRMADVVFERHGATSATIEIGYGTHVTTDDWRRGDPEVTHLFVERSRRATGHFTILLREADGDAFAVIARPLPPGDFAAG